MLTSAQVSFRREGRRAKTHVGRSLSCCNEESIEVVGLQSGVGSDQRRPWWGGREPVKNKWWEYCRTSTTTLIPSTSTTTLVPSTTTYHFRTIQTIVEKVYVWLVGPRRLVSER